MGKLVTRLSLAEFGDHQRKERQVHHWLAREGCFRQKVAFKGNLYNSAQLLTFLCYTLYLSFIPRGFSSIQILTILFYMPSAMFYPARKLPRVLLPYSP